MVGLPHILATAHKYRGVKEIRGKRHNQTVVGWLYRFARNVKLSWIRRKGDEIPWCSVFVSMVLDECGYKGTDHALARSYVNWGKPSRPVPGCVVVIRRRGKPGEDKRTGSRRGYHVMFLDQLSRNYIKGTGGNMKNQVQTASYSRSAYEAIAFRKPAEL